MVEAFTTNTACTIVCTPNKSMNWRQTKLFLALVITWNLMIATGLLLAGAWPILPFMGLEIGGLAGALYYVQWKLSHREVIRIDATEVHLEYGLHWPKFRHSWSRDHVRVALREGGSALNTPQLVIGHRDARRSHNLGRNLNLDDLKKLVNLLKGAGLTVRTTDIVLHSA